MIDPNTPPPEESADITERQQQLLKAAASLFGPAGSNEDLSRDASKKLLVLGFAAVHGAERTGSNKPYDDFADQCKKLGLY